MVLYVECLKIIYLYYLVREVELARFYAWGSRRGDTNTVRRGASVRCKKATLSAAQRYSKRPGFKIG
jgi:hypothetical protein